MGAIKTGLYTVEQEKVATYAKAIGHPARVAILQELAKNQSCQCGELVLTVGLAQSTISQHLKELKNCGLVKGSISEDKPCYCLDRAKFGELMDFLQEVKTQPTFQLSDCCS